MSKSSLKSVLVLGLAASALAAPAPGAPVRRQEEGAVVSNAVDVLSAALATFSTSSSVAASSTVVATEPSGTTTTEPTTEEVEEGLEEMEGTTLTQTDLSVEEFCENAALNSLEGVKQVWNDRGVGKYLDDFLSKDSYANEGDWVNKMANLAFPGSGNSGGYGCGQRDQGCFDALPKCSDMFNDGFGYEYWIFTAVKQMQDTIEHAHENLQDSVIKSHISVSVINDDFKVTISSPNALLKFISAAFSMAGGIVAFGRFTSDAGKLWRDDAKASGTLFAGSFAASAATSPEAGPDPTPDMDKALGNIFDEQLTLLDSYLKLATGGDGDKNTLPDRGPVDGADPQSAIAGFFAQGRFLLQGEDVNDYFSAGYDIIRKKLVDVALAGFGYKILADHNQEDEGMCSEQPWAFWMDLDGGRCMRLTYKDGEANIYPPAGDDVLDKIQNDYKLDVKGYFATACDCAINGDDSKEVDLGAIPDEAGTPPRCFYNLDCMDAEIWLHGDNPDNDDDWVIGWPISFKEVMSWDN